MDTASPTDPSDVPSGDAVPGDPVDGVVPGTASGDPEPDLRTLRKQYGQRIVAALCTLAEDRNGGVNSQASAVLTALAQCCTPSLAIAGQSHFRWPITVRCHPGSGAKVFSRFLTRNLTDLLCQLGGSCVLGFYYLSISGNLAHHVLSRLDADLGLLEYIARDGFREYRIYGDEATGFTLIHK
jgi:hypothetical protein